MHKKNGIQNASCARVTALVRKRKRDCCESMPSASGVRGVYRNCNGWVAKCRVRGKLKHGPTRGTIEEAAKDYDALKREQDQGKVERKQAKALAYDAQRAEHADHLNANEKTYGGSQAKDALGRALVKLAMAEDETLGVADGVEYSIDQHLFYKQESYDFDPKFDAELDDRVLTLALELKVSQSLQVSNGTYDNPQIFFKNIYYADQDATLVLMIYVPKEYTEANADALDNALFWFERAKHFRPANGEKKYSLYTSKSRPLRDLPNVLRTEIDCHTLVPYGHRSRQFKNEDHRLGQAAIDAFEDQVLRPIGAKLMPVEGEGGAEDRILVYYDGRREKIQVKKVCVHEGRFYVDFERTNGSIRLPSGKRRRLKRPYSIEDDIDAFVFVALKEDNKSLAEYWYANVCAMLGDGPADRLITDRDGVRGVQGLNLYPWEHDATKYGLRDPKLWKETDRKERTQAWIRDLGGIMPLSLAQQLKEEQREERDEERAERKRQRLI